jgi:hypothetical protein
MKRTLAIAALVASGCASDYEPVAERDVDTVSDLLDALDVERSIALAVDPESTLQLDHGCRVSPDTGAPFDDQMAPTDILRWEGPCQLEDGAQLDGSLTLTPTPDGQVLSAESFSVTADGDTLVMLSGAMELTRIDNLLELHVSMHACGAVGIACAGTEDTPTVGLDLDYSVYPMDTFPSAYSVSVSGAVDGNAMFVSVEGAWQTDETQCDAEPVLGSMVLDTLPRQTLTLEGGDQCDGCVDWQVEGVDVAPLCADTAW